MFCEEDTRASSVSNVTASASIIPTAPASSPSAFTSTCTWLFSLVLCTLLRRDLRTPPLNQHRLASAGHGCTQRRKLVAKNSPIAKTFLCDSSSTLFDSAMLTGWLAVPPRKCHVKSSFSSRRILFCFQAHSRRPSNFFIMSRST